MPTGEESLASQVPSQTQTIRVSPSTCHNLSIFKGACHINIFSKPSDLCFQSLDILKEYRRIDDTIIMRLNRANATARDQERSHRGSGGGTIQDQACASLWRELTGMSLPMAGIDYLFSELGHWKRRSELLEYCTTVVDQALIEKRKTLEDQAQNPTSRREIQGAVFQDEVKVPLDIIRHQQ